jgi:hypothetical protein
MKIYSNGIIQLLIPMVPKNPKKVQLFFVFLLFDIIIGISGDANYNSDDNSEESEQDSDSDEDSSSALEDDGETVPKESDEEIRLKKSKGIMICSKFVKSFELFILPFFRNRFRIRYPS